MTGLLSVYGNRLGVLRCNFCGQVLAGRLIKRTVTAKSGLELTQTTRQT